MHLRRAIELFDSYEPFRQFKKAIYGPVPGAPDNEFLRDRALRLAERHESKPDRSDLISALSELAVSLDQSQFHQVFAMLAFMVKTFFRDVSAPVPQPIRRKIVEFEGPRFFFVGHTSYFDYVLASQLIRRIGIPPAVTHVTGSLTGGWMSNWLKGFRSMLVPKISSPLQHRAYSWFSAALAEAGENQVLFARTSRYTVRSRDGILREPYVPHGVIAGVKAAGKALVIPVAVSYAAIPEDSHLTSPKFFPVLTMFPRAWAIMLPLLLGLGNADKIFKYLEGVFGDVSVDIGEPFELTDDDSLSLQRISHRAIEEIARNKMIHTTQLVAKVLNSAEPMDSRTIRLKLEQEIENTKLFFKTRYRKDPPFHPLIDSDLPGAVSQGLRILTRRGAVSRLLFKRAYSVANPLLVRFYAYHADRRIYPLSGRNTLTVVNAGVWGYTLALHIGMNLLKKEELSGHSLVLYDSREDLIEKLTVEGKHPWHFKDIALPRSVRPEADLIAAVGDTSLILIVTPSKYFHSNLIRVLELAVDGSDLVIATKGFIPETGLLPCQTARQEMQRLGKRMRISVLSGANLAHEIVQGGAGVTQLACEDYETFRRLRSLIETRLFRVVYSDDVIGTTISAALKNVYAIGFGILEGSKRAPENFLATYSTLVTAEIRKFGLLLGASPETFDAESQVWMADLLATCRGGRSASFGRDLASMEEKSGKNKTARGLLDQYSKKKIAIEGFEASRFANRMATQRGFHPPILGEIYSILHGGKQLDMDGFIEKCLDALSHKSAYPLPSITRSRSQLY
jgi:glycerol-3-phosphate dehydrogenase (NAD(P)+)